MKPYYPTKELEEENDRLCELIINSNENLSIDEFIDKYASDDYKKYLVKRRKRYERLLAKGIMV